MAIPSGVYHVVFGGDLPGGETWQSGFWVQGAVPSDALEANATAELWWGVLTSEDASGAVRIQLTYCSVQVTMRYVRVYPYPSGGPTSPYIGEFSDDPLVGTSSAPKFPNQVCSVVSLRTALSGRRHRGRMYLPCNGIGLENSANMGTANAQGLADAWATAFSDWNTSGDNGGIVVVSQAGTSASPVNNVVVDSRLDIQRRRANRQTIAYHTQATVTPVTP
jgi:hypothetical protein